MSDTTNTGYHNFMLELINLQSADYDKFLDKLYEGLTGEFAGAIQSDVMLNNGDPDQNTDAKIRALDRMIKHFEGKEEYEKCAKIKVMIEELERKEIPVKA